MSGGGTVVVDQGADVGLTGINTYTGGTILNVGSTLEGTATGLQGNILTNDNSSVLFIQSVSGIYSGAISGTGGVEVDGPGEVVLTGNNTFSGTITVERSATLGIGSDAAVGTGGINILRGSVRAVGGSRIVTIPTYFNIATFGGSANLTFMNGYFSTGDLVNNNTATTTVYGRVYGNQNITVNAGQLAIGLPNSFVGFQTQGLIEVNGGATLTALSAGFATLGVGTTLNNGTLAAPNGIALGTGQTVVGSGAIVGRVAASPGSIIEATGDLAIGDSAAYDGFYSSGVLNTNNHVVTIKDRNEAVLGSLTNVGNVTGPGTLAAPNGFLLDAGKNVVGYGTVNGVFKNQGFVQGQGPLPTDALAFNDLVTGKGNFGGNVVFNGGYSPGNSPAAVSFENATFSKSATLTMELGGHTPGTQFDQVNATGRLTLGGQLKVALIDGFAPAAGDHFTILNYSSHTGVFDSMIGSDLGNGLSIEATCDATTFGLTVVSTPSGWNIDGGGNWSTGGLPNAPGATARLLGKLTGANSPGVITLDGDKTVGNIVFGNPNSYVLTPGSGGSLTIWNDCVAASVTVSTGHHTIAVPVIVSGSANVDVAASAGLDVSAGISVGAGGKLTKANSGALNISGGVNLGNGASLVVDGGLLAADNIRGGTVAINASGKITIKPDGSSAGVTRLHGLTLNGAGLIDLSNNDLILDADSATRFSVASTIANQIKSARNTAPGLWQGVGITSSAAAADAHGLTGLAVILNDNGAGKPIYTTFTGQPVDVNSILVKYTYNGDMDLNGKVDADDYFLIDRGFAAHLAGYRNGDLDYNGSIDADDYFLIDNAFARQNAILAGGSLAASAVPEPGTLMLVGAVGTALLTRRRRRI
jgi:autotransporter-associated beta strand protein